MKKYKLLKPLIKAPGVYLISCSKTDKVYIGESINLSNRICKHFSLLRYNKHSNVILQNIYNKYGEKSFNVDVLEYVKEKDKNLLREKELEYQKQYSNCISFDTSVSWNTNKKSSNKKFLQSIRALAVDKKSKPLVLYNVKIKNYLYFNSRVSALKHIPNKILYKHLIKNNYIPYNNLIAIDFDNLNSFDYSNIYCNVDTKSAFYKSYTVYDYLNKEELKFSSLRQLCIYFNKRPNNKYFDNNKKVLDYNFKSFFKIQNIRDLYNLDYVYNKENDFKRRIVLSKYINALINFKTVTKFAKDCNISRSTATKIIKEENAKKRLLNINKKLARVKLI